MVLTQRMIAQGMAGRAGGFPYHYGSYATRYNHYVRLGKHQRVSIPLWFLRNILLRARSLAPGLSFHTTMDLTQHSHCKRSCQTAFGVSIPLWFLRNQWATGPASRLPVRFHTTMVLTQQELWHTTGRTCQY